MSYASWANLVNNNGEKNFHHKKTNSTNTKPAPSPDRKFVHNNVVDPQKIKDLQNQRSETAIPKLKITSYKNK